MTRKNEYSVQTFDGEEVGAGCQGWSEEGKTPLAPHSLTSWHHLTTWLQGVEALQDVL